MSMSRALTKLRNLTNSMRLNVFKNKKKEKRAINRRIRGLY